MACVAPFWAALKCQSYEDRNDGSGGEPHFFGASAQSMARLASATASALVAAWPVSAFAAAMGVKKTGRSHWLAFRVQECLATRRSIRVHSDHPDPSPATGMTAPNEVHCGSLEIDGLRRLLGPRGTILARIFWEFSSFSVCLTQRSWFGGATSLRAACQGGTGIKFAHYVRLGRIWYGSERYSAARLVR
jgi:hypothetical protein